MSDTDQTITHVVPKAPEIVEISWGTIITALGKGTSDFLRAPQYGLFFGAFFAAGGLAILAFLNILNTLWLILPIMIGFPLIGPFAATGIYEVSRRLSTNEHLSFKGVMLSVFEQRERQTGWIAFVVLFIFWVWIYLVRVLIAVFMGFNAPSSLSGFIEVVLTTQSGLTFLMVGTMVGAVLALILFSATVISMPLLLDSDLDFVTAMITSFQTVLKSPVPMLGWGVIVTLLAMVAMVPLFLGLVVIFPILGHTTWHLYKAATRPTT